MTVPLLVTLVAQMVVIGLLSGLINRLQNRVDTLTDRLVARSDDALVREHELRKSSVESTEHLLQSVSDAVVKQVSVLQESVKVAWSPQPTPQTVTPDSIQKMMMKYNLPVPQDVGEHDFGTDPTDQYLSDGITRSQRAAVMMPMDGLDSDEPFGIPGLKAVV